MTAALGHHQVVVVRVERCDSANGALLIELREISRQRQDDLILGRTSNVADACAALEAWLMSFAAMPDAGSESTQRIAGDG